MTSPVEKRNLKSRAVVQAQSTPAAGRGERFARFKAERGVSASAAARPATSSPAAGRVAGRPWSKPEK